MSERAQITLQVAIVVGVLAAGVYGIATSVQAQPPPIAKATVGPDASLIAQTVRSPSPSPTPSATPLTAAPSPSPTPTRRPMTVTAYRCIDRPCTGVQLGSGWTVVAPYDGRVELHVYQLVDGQIREFTDAPGVAKYPYVEVVALDGRRMRLRPGALETATQLVAKEGAVKAGDDLFRVIGEGASSWKEFYDPQIAYQIVVSLSNAAGADLDASSLIKVR